MRDHHWAATAVALTVLLMLSACNSSSGRGNRDAESGPDTSAETTASDATDATDGADGADGSTQTDETSVSDATDGSDQSDGTDGADGSDGVDGADQADGTDGASGCVSGTTSCQGNAVVVCAPDGTTLNQVAVCTGGRCASKARAVCPAVEERSVDPTAVVVAAEPVESV